MVKKTRPSKSMSMERLAALVQQGAMPAFQPRLPGL
jgi:hypothetical protein